MWTVVRITPPHSNHAHASSKTSCVHQSNWYHWRGKKITEDHYNSILVVPEIKVTGYKKKKRFISIQMKDSEKRIRWLAPSHIKMTNRLVTITQTWHPFHLMNTDSILCKYVAQKKVNSDYISIYGLFFLLVDLFNCWIYENVEFQ